MRPRRWPASQVRWRHGVDRGVGHRRPEGRRADERAVAGGAAAAAAGIETVLQYACRDRYLLGMQSDLLGAHAVGVRNLVLFTGDPRKSGDYSDATLGLRRRLHRPDQRRGAAEPRPRCRRPADRAAHRVPHRRRRQPDGAAHRRGSAALRVQGRGRGRVRRDPANLRHRGARSLPGADRDIAGAADRRDPSRSRACCTPSTSPTRCRTCTYRMR